MKSNTLVIILITLLAAAGIYWYFFVGSGNAPALTADTSVNQAQTRFQVLVSELQPISFQTDIFSDARFNALVDLATPIAPEPAGRLDPFAPLK